MTAGPNETYPARLTIDYPDRDLDRLSTLLRLIYVIPIAIVLGLVGGSAFGDEFGESGASIAATGGGVLVGPVLLMILFRQKYPRWWFDFHLQLARLLTRVNSYLALMSDTYPSTDEEQGVHLDLDYPERRAGSQPLAAAGEMAAGHSPLHHPLLLGDRSSGCRDRCLVCCALHRPLSPGHL